MGQAARPHEEAPRVLVVDDDEGIRHVVTQTLLEEGYSVVGAADAREADAALRQDGISVIILDLFLPGEDGWRFRERLLGDPAHRGIPVVVISAVSPDDPRNQRLDAAAFLRKPFTLPQLIRAVGDALRGSAEPADTA